MQNNNGRDIKNRSEEQFAYEKHMSNPLNNSAISPAPPNIIKWSCKWRCCCRMIKAKIISSQLLQNQEKKRWCHGKVTFGKKHPFRVFFCHQLSKEQFFFFQEVLSSIQTSRWHSTYSIYLYTAYFSGRDCQFWSIKCSKKQLFSNGIATGILWWNFGNRTWVAFGFLDSQLFFSCLQKLVFKKKILTPENKIKKRLKITQKLKKGTPSSKAF